MTDEALPILARVLKGCTDVAKSKTFGRRHSGYYARFPSGKYTYIVLRRNMQLYRGKELTQTEALQKDTAAWMIDKEVLRGCKKAGVDMLVFFVKDTGDFYASPLATWFDGTKAKDTVLRGWGEVRHLGVHHMAKTTIYPTMKLK